MTAKRTSGISVAVLRHLQRNRGTELYADDIVAALDAKYTKQQVISAINHLRRSANIVSPRKGWYIYISGGNYKPKPVPMKQKAQVVAMLDNGALLIEVEGTLYVAREMEVEV